MRPTGIFTRNHERRRGFSLIELLVVIGIIAIIAGVTFSAAGQIGRSGRLESSINTISAALNVARSIALRDGKDAAVLFAAGTGDQPYQMRIVVKNTTESGTNIWGFRDFDDRPPDSLGTGVRVASPTFTGAAASPCDWVTPRPRENTTGNLWGADSSTLTDKWLGVWFNSDGTIKTISEEQSAATYNFYFDANASSSFTNVAGPTGEVYINWVPFIAIYDNKDFERSNVGTLANWLNTTYTETQATANRPRMLTFNRYSGLLQKN